MAIMKIRGGDLDLVEYEFTSFLPGEQIKTLDLEKDYKSDTAERCRNCQRTGTYSPYGH